MIKQDHWFALGCCCFKQRNNPVFLGQLLQSILPMWGLLGCLRCLSSRSLLSACLPIKIFCCPNHPFIFNICPEHFFWGNRYLLPLTPVGEKPWTWKVWDKVRCTLTQLQTENTSLIIIIIIIIIINLIYIAQFDTNGILTVLYIVITYIQMQYVHVCTYAKQSYKYIYTCLHIHTYTVTCTNIHLLTY